MAQQLRERLGGMAITSLVFHTRIGVRVPGACWTATPEHYTDDSAGSAPEICVEVASPGSTTKWLLEKAAAYLEAGPRELAIVALDGRVRYYDAQCERVDSAFGLELDTF